MLSNNVTKQRKKNHQGRSRKIIKKIKCLWSYNCFKNFQKNSFALRKRAKKMWKFFFCCVGGEKLWKNKKRERERERWKGLKKFDVLTGNKLWFKGLFKCTCGDPANSDASCLILIGGCCSALATEFAGDFLRPSISASIELDFGKGLNLKLLCEDA